MHTSDSALLRKLPYVYDAGGQLTKPVDRAQPDVFSNNPALTAHQHATYDAWRWILQATGREHASVFAGPLEQVPCQVVAKDAMMAWVVEQVTGAPEEAGETP